MPKITTPKKVERKYTTLANKDEGKVLVRIDARTQVYETPEAAAAFYAQQKAA